MTRGSDLVRFGRNSFCSSRTAPPELQSDSLEKADRDIRHSLSGSLWAALSLSDDDWRLLQGFPASGFLQEASVPVAKLNMPLQLMWPAQPTLRNSAVSCGPMSISLTVVADSFDQNAESLGCPKHRRRKASPSRSKLKSAGNLLDPSLW